MTDKKQAERFRQIARELECDDDEARFNENLKRIAREGGKKVPPEPRRKKESGE